MVRVRYALTGRPYKDRETMPHCDYDNATVVSLVLNPLFKGDALLPQAMGRPTTNLQQCVRKLRRFNLICVAVPILSSAPQLTFLLIRWS